jgi:glutamate racemase
VATQARFFLQPCDGLADAIEALSGTGDATNSIAIGSACTRAIGPFGSKPGEIDTLVLGCTHYPLVADILQALVGEAVQLIDTGAPVARQTRRRLAAGHLLAPERSGQGGVKLFATGDTTALQAAAARWLALPDAVVATCTPHHTP